MNLKKALKMAGLLVIMCASLTSAVLHAQPVAPDSEPRRTQAPERDVPASEGLNQKQALDIARARFSGNVISINEVRPRNAAMRYRIRMDNEGNIFTVFVDSRTGAVSRE